MGTNALLAAGSAPVRGVGDILAALGLVRPGALEALSTTTGSEEDPVLEALGWEPATIDQLVMRTSLGVEDIAVALSTLEVGGKVQHQGGWWERVAA